MKIVIILGLLILVLVFAEAISLVKLGKSVSNYEKYWKELPNKGDFVYIALGDSAAQGIGASKPDKGYVGQIAEKIKQKTGKSINIVNLSVSGAKIDDVINDQLPKMKNYKPDLITIEIGANEMVQYDSGSFIMKYSKLAELLPKGTFVSDIPNFGGRIRRDSETREASKIIADLVNKNGLNLVKLHQITRENESVFNYSADFFHPNERGYRLWATAFWQEIEPKL